MSTKTRITIEDIKSNIKTVHYFTAGQGAKAADSSITDVSPTLNSLTICVIELINGFVVTGESACVDPANYDRLIGEKIAYEQALDKIWPLMGYELKTKLSSQ